MDHLLRNSENRGAGRLWSPRLPTYVYFLTPSASHVNSTENRYTALNKRFPNIKAKVYTKHTS